MIPILMYHQIGRPAVKGSPYRSLIVHPTDFRRQMTWLRRFGYRGLSMRDLLPYVRGERHGKVVGITFDDGYRNVYQHALPILREQDFTATNYFVARQLDGGNVWDYEKGIAHADLMSIDEMRNWALAGMEVGSHTLDHPFLPKLSPEVADYQIRQSKQELEAVLDSEVTAFCYPYGGESPDVRAMVRSAGYTNATTTQGGLAKESDDLFGLPRVTVARSTNIFRFLQKCMTRLEEKRRKE
ncbi:polysaccharide deacetylase family protein [Pollutimonas sp. H1-120]|uniref:polysaccharide deacetylase family protein n=1 Tax=Pollutimonas sp. H1-120 TaxID=3148824 RepID=UPI003B52F576